MKKQIRKDGRSGMTLLEVMLVIAILGVIAALVVPKMIGRQKLANIDATKLSIDGLAQALKMYAVDHDGEYPSSSEGIKALFEKPVNDEFWNGPYLDIAARDAWGNRFEYRYPGNQNPSLFDIVSPGPDGIPNTEDDISNKMSEKLY